jgi:hypothetical protein
MSVIFLRRGEHTGDADPWCLSPEPKIDGHSNQQANKLFLWIRIEKGNGEGEATKALFHRCIESSREISPLF